MLLPHKNLDSTVPPSSSLLEQTKPLIAARPSPIPPQDNENRGDDDDDDNEEDDDDEDEDDEEEEGDEEIKLQPGRLLHTKSTGDILDSKCMFILFWTLCILFARICFHHFGYYSS